MFTVSVLFVLSLVGCTPETAETVAPEPVQSRACMSGDLDATPTGEFESWWNQVSAWEDAKHIAEDVLVTDGADAPLFAKFAYGPLFNDLEDEEVEIWLSTCSGGVRFVGAARTNDKGQLDTTLDAGLIDGVGDYTLFYRVVGDGTIATATLRSFAVGTRIQVFDIDGTLTTADSELFVDLFSELSDGSYVPEARGGAVETVRTRVDQGYPIVYLTGRPYWLDGITNEWLDDLDFPFATLHLARTNADILPLESSVGEYKATYLDHLLALGFEVDFAYGNATTDIYGYGMAGVDPAATLIMGTHGGEGGTVAGGDDYWAHLAEIELEPAAQQP